MDKAFPSPAVVIGAVGQQKVIQNMGAKRIQGTELLTLGKVPQFVYYLVDIQSMIFYANDGTDTWIGGFGQPVAGSLTVRDSLSPFESQRFYVIEQDTGYEFKGGVWVGGVVEGNNLSPTFIELNAPTSLTRGRSHIIVADGDYVLPKLDDTVVGKGKTLTGHAMQVVVARGVSANVVEATGEGFINDLGDTETAMIVGTGNLYTFVYSAVTGKWEVFVVDIDILQTILASKMDKAANLSDVLSPAAARANLDVLSSGEVEAVSEANVDAISAGDGITKTGSAAAGNITLSADFATVSEAADPSVTDKVLAPSNIASAVTAATRQSEFNNITGLLPKATETKFNLTLNGVDNTLIDFPEFTVVFNPEPYVRDSALTIVTIPAGSIQLDNIAGSATQRLVVNNTGSLYFASTIPAATSVDECYLGFAISIDGTVTVPSNLGVRATPWLASSEYKVRADELTIVGGLYTASPTVGKLARSAATIRLESANWINSTLSPHDLVVPANDPAVWTYIDRAGNIVGTVNTDEVNGELLDDGSPIANNKYSIQVAFVGIAGNVAVLLGQVDYNDLTDALAQAENYSPILPNVLTGTREIGRWIVKGDQYPGSGALDLAVSSNFTAQATNASTSGGVGSVSSSDVTSSNAQNTLATTNLQTQINELSARTDWEIVSGGGVQTDPNLLATDSNNYSVAVPEAGVRVRFAAFGGVSPTLQVTTGNIVSSNGLFPDDVAFQILAADNGKIYELISDGTNLIL